MKFRVIESPVPIKMVEALDATATPMPGTEMYAAMQMGVVDGQENPVQSIIQDLTYDRLTQRSFNGIFESYLCKLK